MTPNEGRRQAQFDAQRADFVFEQFAQGLNQFEAHLFGQAADVVVAFDRHGRAARKRHRFDHVWVKRALGKEFCAFDGVGVFLEHVDEQAANDLALGFGVGLALQVRP